MLSPVHIIKTPPVHDETMVDGFRNFQIFDGKTWTSHKSHKSP